MQPSLPPPTFELEPSPSPGKVRYTHEAMIDLILGNSTISQNEIAAYFGYSVSHISRIMTSDAFRARLAERRGQVVDPVLREQVKANFENIVLESQKILLARLKGTKVADSTVLRAMEISSRAAGFGARQESLPVDPADVAAHLDALQENLVGMLRRGRTDIEGEVIDVPSEDENV